MDLQTLEAKQSRLAFNAKARLARAEKEERSLTPEEEQADEIDVKAMEDLGKRIDKVRRQDESHAALEAVFGDDKTAEGHRRTSGLVISRVGGALKSLGQQFIEQPEMKTWLESKAFHNQSWRSPAIDLEVKAILTEDPASGGGLVLPDYQPGIVPTPTRKLTIAALFPPGAASSNAIAYPREKLFTNAAAPVLEGGLKPESAITFEQVTEPLRKIAHWLPVSEEMLEDVVQVRSYIDARLRLGVQLTEEDQLLNGDGVAPNLLGILKHPGLAPAVAQTTTAADAILEQKVSLEVANPGFIADGVLINPRDWQHIRSMKDSTGAYLGEGPFATVNGVTVPTLWYMPVIETTAMPAGTALVGCFQQGGQIFRRGGIRVEASNSHQDFFIKNLVAIRAEERLALALYRPGAFGTVTGLAAVVTPPAVRR